MSTEQTKFNEDIMKMFAELELLVGVPNKKTDRMIIITKIYKRVYTYLKPVLKRTPNYSIQLICVIYNKCVEFDSENKKGKFDEVDFNLRQEFIQANGRVKYFLMNHLKQINGKYPVQINEFIRKAYENIELEEAAMNERPKRKLSNKGSDGSHMPQPFKKPRN